MKILEIYGRIPIVINNEENLLIKKIKKRAPLNTFNEREIEVARILTNKGVLKRSFINGKVNYTIDSLK